MPRWRQDRETGELVPIDETAARQSGGHAVVHGDIESFVSPVDGTVISDRKQLREHNKRNNVVCADEFSPEHYQRKMKEQEAFFTGKHSKEETFKRKQEIYNSIIRAERNGR